MEADKAIILLFRSPWWFQRMEMHPPKGCLLDKIYLAKGILVADMLRIQGTDLDGAINEHEPMKGCFRK